MLMTVVKLLVLEYMHRMIKRGRKGGRISKNKQDDENVEVKNSSHPIFRQGDILSNRLNLPLLCSVKEEELGGNV